MSSEIANSKMNPNVSNEPMITNRLDRNLLNNLFIPMLSKHTKIVSI